MKHYGDITKINGAEVPIVDIVCGGSPCQDLSVAGLRKGLAGERSGLFMEQIRIVKEMRDESIKQLRMRGTDDLRGNIRCRFLVWENVCGAFSSNTGSDFQAVLEEIAKVAERDACIPGPPNGKWPYAGCVMGSGWSIAWRIHDGQFWGTSILTSDGRVVKRGTPQRRKRISLVADFGGQSAPEILFECKGLSGNLESCGETGQGVASDSERGVDPSSYTLKIRGGVERDSYGKKAGKGPLVQTELSGTLGVSQDQTLITKVFGISSYDSNSMKSDNPNSGIYEADTTRTLDLNGGNPACNQGGMAVVQGVDAYNQTTTGDKAMAIRTKADTEHIPCVVRVEGEVTVRKYPVNTERLIECIQSHRNMSIGEVAKQLNKPKTLVEHWFRKDKCFAIPDADIWLQFKELLGIDTDEFDESIMTFETQVGKYDMANRIHMGDVSPTLMAGSDKTLYCLEGNGSRESHKGDGYKESETMYTLNTVEQHAVCIENHPNDSRCKISENGVVQTLSSRMGTGGNNTPMVMENKNVLYSIGHDERSARYTDDEKTDPLTATDYKDPIKVMCGTYQKVTGTLDCGITKGTGNQLANSDMFVANSTVVRRLTPLECERLQGFPDFWTDIGDWVDSKGKKHKGESDSPRYKALGNSICLPFWQWMSERMVKVLKDDGIEHPTMASLFDGIGGFPLVYSRCGCDPVWASEIEEFPIAVTKIRFPDKEG